MMDVAYMTARLRGLQEDRQRVHLNKVAYRAATCARTRPKSLAEPATAQYIFDKVSPDGDAKDRV